MQLPNQAIRYFSSRAKKAVAFFFLNELPPLPTNVQAGCARSLPVVSIAALGLIERLYVLSPDRLSRKYAHQVLLIEELSACGVEVVFLNHAIGATPEEALLLQMQGMIAEYERAKIMERNRRGKLHGAKRGSVNVLSTAPYG